MAYSNQPHRLSLPLVGKKVEDLLLWRDVPKSGLAFGLATLLYLILEWSHLSLLTILANSALVLVSIAFLWNNIAAFSNRPGLPVPDFVRSGVRESDVRSYAEVVAGYLNKGLAFVNRVLHGKEVVLTAQIALALFIFGKVGAYFTSLGLLYTIVLLAFTVPKAYELNKPQVDKLLNHGQAQVKTNYNKYLQPYVDKIPRASTSTHTNKPLIPPASAPPASTTYSSAPNTQDIPFPSVSDASLPNGGKKVY